MADLILYTVFGYILGAVPFAYLIGKYFAGTDIRLVGDGNPGGTNVWLAGGWRIGLLTVGIEIMKGFLPVFLARRAGLSGWSLVPILLAPILGHGTQPFLNFRGGKALGVTGGAWIGIIGFWVFPLFSLGAVPMMILQKENAYAAMAGMLVLAGYGLYFNHFEWVAAFSILNTLFLLWTHRKHLGAPIVPREWLARLFARRTA